MTSPSHPTPSHSIPSHPIPSHVGGQAVVAPKANTRARKKKGQAAPANAPFQPDHNLQISFHSGGSGGGGGGSGITQGAFVFGSPNVNGGYGGNGTRTRKRGTPVSSSRQQQQQQPSSFLSPTFNPAPQPINNGLRSGGGFKKATYTPPAPTRRIFSGGVGDVRRAGPKDVRRPQGNPVDRVVSELVAAVCIFPHNRNDNSQTRNSG